jgi:hypothetical protein
MRRLTSDAREHRLTHDRKAHLRSIQISQKRLFVYCEGREHDPYIYSELISRTPTICLHDYELYKIEEITGTGGKNGVIAHYEYIKSEHLLQGNFKGKAICCVFFLDKDIDELKRTMIRSRHVFYTQMYDLEGQIYHDCDFARAIAIALSIDLQKVPSPYRDSRTWIEQKAIQWQEWLILCAFSAVFAVDCGCGYGRPSAINSRHLSITDIAEFNSYKLKLATECCVSIDKFERRFSLVQR